MQSWRPLDCPPTCNQPTAADSGHAGEGTPREAVERPPHLRRPPGRPAPRRGTGSPPRTVAHSGGLVSGWQGVGRRGDVGDGFFVFDNKHPPRPMAATVQRSEPSKAKLRQLMEVPRLSRTLMRSSRDVPSTMRYCKPLPLPAQNQAYRQGGIAQTVSELGVCRPRPTVGGLPRERHVQSGTMAGRHAVLSLGVRAVGLATGLSRVRTCMR